MPFSCCESEMDKIEISLDDESEEKEGQGCCGDQCDCLCCGQIFTPTSITELQSNQLQIACSLNTFVNRNLTRLHLNIPWQPPRCSK